jgi:hypothetical protein
MLYYRFGLPLLAGGTPAHSGTWHAVLGIGDRSFIGRTRGQFAISEPGKARVRYSVNVQAYSNVRMAATLTQNSFEPGATLAVRAGITEFGIPLTGARVQTQLRRPDGTQSMISLAEVAPGVFETNVVAGLAGVYQFRVLANGWTHRGEGFEREQLLTGVAAVGSNSPSPTTPPSDHRDEVLCRLLECLLSKDALGGWLQQNHIDPVVLERCVTAACQAIKAPPSNQELAEREGVVSP